jgi:hypothetical protein
MAPRRKEFVRFSKMDSFWAPILPSMASLSFPSNSTVTGAAGAALRGAFAAGSALEGTVAASGAGGAFDFEPAMPPNKPPNDDSDVEALPTGFFVSASADAAADAGTEAAGLGLGAKAPNIPPPIDVGFDFCWVTTGASLDLTFVEVEAVVTGFAAGVGLGAGLGAGLDTGLGVGLDAGFGAEVTFGVDAAAGGFAATALDLGAVAAGTVGTTVDTGAGEGAALVGTFFCTLRELNLESGMNFKIELATEFHTVGGKRADLARRIDSGTGRVCVSGAGVPMASRSP